MCDEKLPVITPAIEEVIASLQDPNGPAMVYQSAIAKMFNKIIVYQDELEMSAQEAMSALRALWMLGEDLCILARTRVAAMTQEHFDSVMAGACGDGTTTDENDLNVS